VTATRGAGANTPSPLACVTWTRPDLINAAAWPSPALQSLEGPARPSNAPRTRRCAWSPGLARAWPPPQHQRGAQWSDQHERLAGRCLSHLGGATDPVPVDPEYYGSLNVGGGPPREEDRHSQACDLHLWCAVRELNPQPADYSRSDLTLTVVSRFRCPTKGLPPSDNCPYLLLWSSKRALSGHLRCSPRLKQAIFAHQLLTAVSEIEGNA
jgi:hypothetical protein